MNSAHDWTDGYHTDIDYTYGYYGELNPLRVSLAFLSAGLARPHIRTACELGFGQGISVNIHAAAAPTQWYGTDFNPVQAGFAQELAEVSGSGAKLFDDAFDAFARRDDLPDFDYIGLHGIWSWINDANRQALVDFIGRKLKVGGVLYISYNTLPGWSRAAPLRYLLTEHARMVGSLDSGVLNRIDASLEFATRVMNAGSLFARQNPQSTAWLEDVKKKDHHYLAHEYYNADWEPMYFSAMAQWLQAAKLQFACSADLIDQFDSVGLTEQQRKVLAEVRDPVFRQGVRDFLVNRQFRRDYWVKGARRLPNQEARAALRAERILLVTPRKAVTLKVAGPMGTITLRDDVCNPILDTLADHAPKTLGELETELAPRGVSLRQIEETVLLLASGGHVACAQEAGTVTQAKPHADALNARFMRRAHSGDQVRFLASPVTGGGVLVNQIEQLFIETLRGGVTQPADWAEAVWQILSAQGRTLVKDGKPLAGADENLSQLRQIAEGFAAERLPLLQTLQVA